MRLIHTADWHLGKHIEGHSRLEEQELFLEDFVNIVKERDADVVLIAGDIYDSSNPPAKAEQLFYDTLKKISDGGRRLTIVIAGIMITRIVLCRRHRLRWSMESSWWEHQRR